MAYLSCLVCGALTDSSYCIKHRSREARGYGWQHRITRIAAIRMQPFCTICHHLVNPDSGVCDDSQCVLCPLELHHIYGKGKSGYAVLCRVHNRAIGKPRYRGNING